MRIGIDAHCIGQRKGGNETYTINLVKHLSLLEPNGDEYIAYLTDAGMRQYDIFLNGRMTKRLIRPSNPYLRIPFGFALEDRRRRLDVFHAQYFLPFNLRCKTVLTVHDIIYERFPQFYTSTDLRRNRLGIPSSCRRADHIIAVSECTKRDLVEIYSLDPDRITVTEEGPAENCKLMDSVACRHQLRSSYGLEAPFILYVGRPDPRKNLSRLLAAFAQLKKKGAPHKLVMVGPKPGDGSDILAAARDHCLLDHVMFTGHIPAEHLPIFYNAACAFVYPSIYEGFGLPVVEAMACGTPTITSTGSALQEVAGDAAVLADPYDVSSITAAIERVLTDKELQNTLREKGLKRSQKFSFKAMAEQTRQVYRLLAL